MATKKTPAPAPAPAFTVEHGCARVVLPATYVPDARRSTFNAGDYNKLTKSREPLRVAAALEQIADTCEAEPDLAPLPQGYTIARLRAIAAQLRAIHKALSDLQAALTELGELAKLDRDVAADAINDILASFKVLARRNAVIKDRFDLLFNLHKR
jgi:hypothetical protein